MVLHELSPGQSSKNGAGAQVMQRGRVRAPPQQAIVEIAVAHNFPLSELAVILQVFRTAQRIESKIDYTIRIVSHDKQVYSEFWP